MLQIHTGTHHFEIKELSSYLEVQNVISNCRLGAVVLGGESEVPQRFYSIEIHASGLSDRPAFGIGLLSEGHGLEPEMCLIDDNHLLLGLNSQLAVIDLLQRQVDNVIRLESLFRTLLSTETGQIIVIHDIGIAALARDASLLWNYSEDLVEDWELEENHIRIHFANSSSILVDLRSLIFPSIPER